MSGLLLGIVLSICTYWFHNMVTLCSFASIGHADIMWSIVSSNCWQSLHLLSVSVFKIYYYCYCYYIFSQAIRQLVLILTVTLSCSSPHNLLTLYWTLARSKLEYSSVAWNFITSYVCKLHRIQRQFVSPCYHRFSGHLYYSYGNVSNYFELHTIGARRLFLDILFLTVVAVIQNIFLPFLETFGLRVSNRNFRNLVFDVDIKRRNWTVLPLDALRWQVSSAVILNCSIEFRSCLMVG